MSADENEQIEVMLRELSAKSNKTIAYWKKKYVSYQRDVGKISKLEYFGRHLAQTKVDTEKKRVSRQLVHPTPIRPDHPFHNAVDAPPPRPPKRSRISTISEETAFAPINAPRHAHNSTMEHQELGKRRRGALQQRSLSATRGLSRDPRESKTRTMLDSREPERRQLQQEMEALGAAGTSAQYREGLARMTRASFLEPHVSFPELKELHFWNNLYPFHYELNHPLSEFLMRIWKRRDWHT